MAVSDSLRSRTTKGVHDAQKAWCPGALGLSVLTLGLTAVPAASAQQGSRLATEFPRLADETGDLERFSLRRGECVNIVTGPAGEKGNNFFAGLCGSDVWQQIITGTTNKGECLQVLRALSA